MKIIDRERHIRLAIIADLERLDLLTCRSISQRRATGMLPAAIDARREVASAETVTMATEHAQK